MDRRSKIIFAVIGTLACWPIFLGIALTTEWFSYNSDIKAHEEELAEFKRTDDSTYQVNFKNACDSFATFKLLEVRKVLAINTRPTLCQRVLKVRKTDKMICRHEYKYDYATVCEPLMDTTWTSYQCGTHRDTVWSEGMYNEAARNRGIKSLAEDAASKARGTPPEYSGKSRHWLLRDGFRILSKPFCKLFSLLMGWFDPSSGLSWFFFTILLSPFFLLCFFPFMYAVFTPFTLMYIRRVYKEYGYVTFKDCIDFWTENKKQFY